VQWSSLQNHLTTKLSSIAFERLSTASQTAHPVAPGGVLWVLSRDWGLVTEVEISAGSSKS
jgi:hypothetical protein